VVRSKVHIALNVSDLRKSTEFYRAMFGSEPVRVRPDYAKFDIAEPALNLALNERAPREARPQHGSGTLSHLGIQVGSTDEVLAMARRLEAAGLTTREEMQTDCCYALQDKVWTRDPDGNEWEVFVVLGESVETKELCCATDPKQTKGKERAVTDNLESEPLSRESPSLAKDCCSRDDELVVPSFNKEEVNQER
jgi:catechol 2,3-dioxygenase-like lactoylglutathione lyase family enzyme